MGKTARRHRTAPHSVEQAEEMLDVGALSEDQVLLDARAWAHRRQGCNYDNTTLYALIALAGGRHKERTNESASRGRD